VTGVNLGRSSNSQSVLAMKKREILFSAIRNQAILRGGKKHVYIILISRMLLKMNRLHYIYQYGNIFQVFLAAASSQRRPG
jgi:hypothetical protein